MKKTQARKDRDSPHAAPAPSSVTRRVFVSLPADQWLTPAQNDLKWGIVEKIQEMGYVPEIFTNPKGTPGLASGKAWSAAEADRVARRCVGAAILGFAHWKFKAGNADVRLATEFCQYEGALARTLGLPMLILVQSDVMRRVMFDNSLGPYIGEFPPDTNRSWLQTAEFKVLFDYWTRQLELRRDVFLGYCGSSVKTATKIKKFLERKLKVTVLDWQTNFQPGQTILEQIKEASDRCSGGIFLFTTDDKI